jgi:DNA-binding transcriptional regulator GbsR (MarR family)
MKKLGQSLAEDSVLELAEVAKEAARKLKRRRYYEKGENVSHWQDDTSGVNDDVEKGLSPVEPANNDLESVLADPRIPEELKLVAKRLREVANVVPEEKGGLEESTDAQIQESLEFNGAAQYFEKDRLVCQFTSWEDEI